MSTVGSRDGIDVAVVGGGPVGLAAAIEAALAGLTVVVVEPRALLDRDIGSSDGIDKACGEGLMPGALAAVQRLGVDPEGATVTGITYIAPGGRLRAQHDFTAGPGRGVRRTVLSRALAGRVADLGIPVVRARVVRLAQDGAGVALGLAHREPGAGDAPSPLRARWVLAADGLHSSVRTMVGLGATTDGRRYAVRRHVALAPWSDHVEVHWGPGVEAYVTPVGAHEVGIAIEGRRGDDLVLGRGGDGELADPSAGPLAQLPALGERLAGARWTSSPRGAGPLRQQTSARSAGRVLLVGDAGGYVDALTGEGLRVGLASAHAAVTAIAAAGARGGDAGGHLDVRTAGAEYERAWTALSRDYRVLTSGLVTATRYRPVRSALVPAAAALPAVFAAVVDRLAR